MSESMPYADIIILALIAGFILLRLRGVLGQKMDDDERFMRRDLTPVAPEPIVHVEDRGHKQKPGEEPDNYLIGLKDSTLADSLNAIKAKDPSFTATSFLEGAKLAYEMAFDAFAKADKSALKMLMSDLVYKQFEGAIEAREKEKKRTETTLVAVTSKDITAARLTGNVAQITVKFSSEQVIVVRDEDGKIIEGDASQVHIAEDEWVFERDVTSRNPNWKIIET